MKARAVESHPTDQDRLQAQAARAERNRRYYEKKRLERALYEKSDQTRAYSFHAEKRKKSIEVDVTTAYKSINSVKRTRHAEIIENLKRSYELITKATLPNESEEERIKIGKVHYFPSPSSSLSLSSPLLSSS